MLDQLAVIQEPLLILPLNHACSVILNVQPVSMHLALIVNLVILEIIYNLMVKLVLNNVLQDI